MRISSGPDNFAPAGQDVMQQRRGSRESSLSCPGDERAESSEININRKRAKKWKMEARHMEADAASQDHARISTNYQTQATSGSANNNNNNNNKWSHNHRRQLYCAGSMALCRDHQLAGIQSAHRHLSSTLSISGATQRAQHKLSQRQRTPKGAATLRSSSINLLLSILIGLSLAAIHSSAFSGGGGGGGGGSAQPTTNGIPSTAAAPSGGSQQHAPSGSTFGAQVSATSAGGDTSGRSYLQAPSVTSRPSAAIAGPLDATPGMNLIPIDQPVSGSSGSVALPSGSSFRSAKADSYDGSAINLRSGPLVSMTSSSYPATSPDNSVADDATNGQVQQQQQQQLTEDDFSEPSGQFHGPGTGPTAGDGPPADAGAYQTLVEQQHPLDKQVHEQNPTATPKLSPRQSVERRFGLFKKGQHLVSAQAQHYGAPAMSASYSASPYMSDCERCLAGFGGQQSADLQQLDPAPAPLPTQPILPTQTLQQGGHYPVMQPFAPLKNKFFMKFPFLVKPSPFGDHSASGGAGAGGHYWPMVTPQFQMPSYHQSSLRPSSAGTSPALLIRPAPAYNCIQASSPLLSAAASSYASQAEVAPYSTGGGGGGKTSPVAGVKQQQQHYGHQQQQVQSYAKRK